MGKRASLLQGMGGVASALLVLFVTTFFAQQIRNSELYGKSRLIRLIVAQDEVAIGQIITNPDNAGMLMKFVGAVTNAYINFEMIPVGEVGTFAAVFESAQNGVAVEKFEYHRKNLTITGAAQDDGQYRDFISRLQETGYFENVSGHSYDATDDTVRFQVTCTSRSATGSYLDLTG